VDKGNYYRKQAYIIETMRAEIEEKIGVPTRRTRLRLLSPWAPGKYSYECHPNPYSAVARVADGGVAGYLLPLEVCFNGEDQGLVLKKDPALPYACPVRIMRGPMGMTGPGIIYSIDENVDCRFEGIKPVIYDTYIVEAVLKGSSPVELIVEWCPLGLVEQEGLQEKIEYAIRLASALNEAGRGVKISVVPGYAIGSRHMDGLYWSSGVYYLSEAESASGVSSVLDSHIYIVGEGYVNGSAVLDIPFLYGGWVHSYKSGVPSIAVSTGTSIVSIKGQALWDQVFRSIESFLDDIVGEDLPLEARGVIFHLDIIKIIKCLCF
jgi:hypothetical protein